MRHRVGLDPITTPQASGKRHPKEDRGPLDNHTSSTYFCLHFMIEFCMMFYLKKRGVFTVKKKI